MTRIMIADEDLEWAQTLTEAAALIYGREIEIVCVCDRARDIVRAVCRLRPDVLLFDITFLGLEGLKMIRHLRSLGSSSPTVIVLSTRISNNLVSATMNSGAAYILIKPIRPEIVLERALTFVQQWRPEVEPMLPRPDIGSVLRNYGFPYARKGTEYLRYALTEYLRADDTLSVRDLCKHLAEHYQLNGRTAESRLRDAMRAVWEKGGFDDICSDQNDHQPRLYACIEHIRNTIRREAMK